MRALASLLVALLSFESSSGDESLVAARAVIDHQETKIETFDAEYEIDILARSSLAADTGKSVRQFQRFREQRQGAKFRSNREITINIAESTQPDKMLQTYDGEKFYGYDEANLAGGIFSEGTEPTCLTQTLYLSTIGLGEMLRRNADVAETQWMETAGGRLLSVSWEEAEGATRRTLLLDPKAAYQPQRYTLENEYPVGYYPDGRKRGTLTGVVKEFHRHEDVYLPSVVELTHDEVDAQDRTMRTLTKLVRVKWRALNLELDESLFSLEFPKGTTVIDKDRQVKYIVGKPGSEEPLQSAKPVEAVAATAGPAYEVYADWRFWAAMSALFLGLLYCAKRKGYA